jgi:hypothetical protein
MTTTASPARPIIEIFTDGACSGNPGPGGWGALLRFRDVERELSGGEADTTNNRMEMMAAIMALESALYRASLHRQHVPEGRHHEVDPRLEAQWLDHG